MKGSFIWKIFLICSSLLWGFSLCSGAHFIVGSVEDARDGVSANGYTVTLWNPANGMSDNVTDTVGASGNSGSEGFYLIDCELLAMPCDIGDTLFVGILNNGSNRVTERASLTVSGEGFDAAPDLKLNTPPNVTLSMPANGFITASSSVNFSCRAVDPDFNLANITLFGDWNSWHANQTLGASGNYSVANFSKIIPEGTYEWNCRASDNLSITSFAVQNFSFTIDTSAPVVWNVSANITTVCGNTSYTRVYCTAQDSISSISQVLIRNVRPDGSLFNSSTQSGGGSLYYGDVFLNMTGIWQFRCLANDSAGNSASNYSLNVSVKENLADLEVHSSRIYASVYYPSESEIVLFNATIQNRGCLAANTFLVGFYDGDPTLGGAQIGQNQTLSVVVGGNVSGNVSWDPPVGPTHLYVVADVAQSISEQNESNNKENITYHAPAWQTFYGNTSFQRVLANTILTNFTVWSNSSSGSGNVFVSDVEASIGWNTLIALGRNISGGATLNDFGELDILFNMSTFNDSIARIFTSDGNTPFATANFLIHQQTIASVPVINSTNTSLFVTGIVWDSSDDTDGEFSQSDREDILFITPINEGQVGRYGVYDYEIRIPAKIRHYYPSDEEEVYLYFDLD